MSFKSGVNER